MTRSGVTYETKVWEGDYRTVLRPERLAASIGANRFDFDSRVVMINNVEDPALVSRRCRRLVRAGVIDDYCVVDELAVAALERVGLTRDDLGVGYKYSIAELVGIEVCASPLLLHFSGDSVVPEPCSWLPDAVDLLRTTPGVKVVNLVWNGEVAQVQAESGSEDDCFWYAQGFSDQMYLVRVTDLRDRVYQEHHPASDRYPAYGGELFEKRVDSWMRNHDYLRAISKAGRYEHVNIAPYRAPVTRLTDRLTARVRRG